MMLKISLNLPKQNALKTVSNASFNTNQLYHQDQTVDQYQLNTE